MRKAEYILFVSIEGASSSKDIKKLLLNSGRTMVVNMCYALYKPNELAKVLDNVPDDWIPHILKVLPTMNNMYYKILDVMKNKSILFDKMSDVEVSEYERENPSKRGKYVAIYEDS